MAANPSSRSSFMFRCFDCLWFGQRGGSSLYRRQMHGYQRTLSEIEKWIHFSRAYLLQSLWSEVRTSVLSVSFSRCIVFDWHLAPRLRAIIGLYALLNLHYKQIKGFKDEWEFLLMKCKLEISANLLDFLFVIDICYCVSLLILIHPQCSWNGEMCCENTMLHAINIQ
jgi:hypothetical protein